MNPRKNLNRKRKRREERTRAKISGTSRKPRLSVFRSNRFIYAQLIDDEKGHTLISASSRELPEALQRKRKTEQAALVGKMITEKALKAGIKEAVFDRGSYQYLGRIRSLAEEARKVGLRV